ncbi:MAG TPA: M14 metallopeptidase family protein [Acidobacteriota bacterium]|nr:M14 metallopeptidase family protein [Acidobacteriota bacterium]
MISRSAWGMVLAALMAAQALGQVPHPRDVFGFEPGADYKLADYGQLADYYRKLDAASPRVQAIEIGQSVLERPMLLLFISSSDNLARLEEWRTASEKLARARISAEEAERLADQGKAIVWIDAGLHATERAAAQMAPLLAYRVATEETPEMRRIRDDVVLLLMPIMNPDGLQIVVDWYKQVLGTPYETASPPELYHHYVGHDNNRDWFMNNMPESQAVNRVLYTQWYPQVVYNHHQTGPAWARIFLPPFKDPVNPRIHPGVTTGVNLFGSAMANRFALKRMPGVVSDVIYSMWWNGGMRTVPYFHNMIGLLTETSHSTPTPRYYDPEKRPASVASRRGSQGVPTDGTDIFYPYPWQGGESHFRDAVDYMLTASMAVLDLSSNLRRQLLFNIYSMGRDAIQAAEDDFYAYVIPAHQWDAGEAAALAEVLRQGGIEMERAVAPFQAGGRTFQSGSIIVPAAQAFRPYLLDLMEKQDYPDRRRTPDGPPDPPYDLAGWTLPMQMGVETVRVEEEFQADTRPLEGAVRVLAGAVDEPSGPGYFLSARSNAAVRAVNQLLEEDFQVAWIDAPADEEDGYYVAPRQVDGLLRRMAADLGVDFKALPQPQSPRWLKRPRVGLYKSHVANMDEGWTRWLLENYAFELVSLQDEDIRRGDLSGIDVIVLPDHSAERILNGHRPGFMPHQYVGGLGLEGALALKRYVQEGGRLVALDGACDFAIEQFGLPLRDAVGGLPPQRFFIPGSLVRLSVDTSHALGRGMQKEVAASFVRSRAFEIVEPSRRGEGGVEDTKPAPPPPVEVVARYAAEDILMSGWALGEQRYLSGRAALVQVEMGEGQVVLFAFRPQFRGQPRATYKLFFNALLAP